MNNLELIQSAAMGSNVAHLNGTVDLGPLYLLPPGIDNPSWLIASRRGSPVYCWAECENLATALDYAATLLREVGH